MEGHTLITTSDDVCASDEITFSATVPMAHEMKVHYRTRRRYHHS